MQSFKQILFWAFVLFLSAFPFPAVAAEVFWYMFLNTVAAVKVVMWVFFY